MASAEHGASTRMWVGAPVRPQGGTQETLGRVQPHSLLRESVTSEDLQRREPCFISPNEGPALRHPRPPLGRTEPGQDQEGLEKTTVTTGFPIKIFIEKPIF